MQKLYELVMDCLNSNYGTAVVGTTYYIGTTPCGREKKKVPGMAREEKGHKGDRSRHKELGTGRSARLRSCRLQLGLRENPPGGGEHHAGAIGCSETMGQEEEVAHEPTDFACVTFPPSPSVTRRNGCMEKMCLGRPPKA